MALFASRYFMKWSLGFLGWFLVSLNFGHFNGGEWKGISAARSRLTYVGLENILAAVLPVCSACCTQYRFQWCGERFYGLIKNGLGQINFVPATGWLRYFSVSKCFRLYYISASVMSFCQWNSDIKVIFWWTGLVLTSLINCFTICYNLHEIILYV